MATETQTMRKLLNDPADVVRESLAGLAAAHGDILRVDADAQIVVRAGGARAGKVALVSGGGSGHEPLHGGFVGLGMLDAACPGEVFTSPVPEQMLAATKAVDGGAGVVHLVKNYTGDVMNFKLAAEDAADEGIDVESVLIDDDVAVQDSLYTAGRRGVGATVLAEKIAGAAAERGDDLKSVADIARRVNGRARSFGFALSSCTPPAAGKPIFDLPAGRDGGRHRDPRGAGPAPRGAGDRARDRRRDGRGLRLGPRSRPPAPRCCRSSTAWAAPRSSSSTCSTARSSARCASAGCEPMRRLVGAYITSLEMAGASLTLLELDDELTALWDAPVHTAALRWGA